MAQPVSSIMRGFIRTPEQQRKDKEQWDAMTPEQRQGRIDDLESHRIRNARLYGRRSTSSDSGGSFLSGLFFGYMFGG